MKPRLLRSGLTDRVYVVTRYRERENGIVEAITKYDVTDEYAALAATPAPLDVMIAALRAEVEGLFPSSFGAVHVSPDASDSASYAIGEGAGMSQMKSAVLAAIDRLAATPAPLDVEDVLAAIYGDHDRTPAYVKVAELCDTVFDKSGGLLGRVREKAAAYAEEAES